MKEDGFYFMERWLIWINYLGGELNYCCIIDDLKVFSGFIYIGLVISKYCIFVWERFKFI